MNRLSVAVRVFLEALGGAPYFPADEGDLPPTDAQLAVLMVLHAEAMHDCQHTELPRARLGMLGPRGRPARPVE